MSALLVLGVVVAGARAIAGSPRPPHLVFVLADDLGFFDTSVYNPVAPTPTLAKLAGEGIRLDRHYVYRYCSPTRRSVSASVAAKARRALYMCDCITWQLQGVCRV